jgi:hypothetical protein
MAGFCIFGGNYCSSQADVNLSGAKRSEAKPKDHEQSSCEALQSKARFPRLKRNVGCPNPIPPMNLEKIEGHNTNPSSTSFPTQRCHPERSTRSDA